MQQLPVSVLLLWGVVAVELREADAARATLGQYLAATQGNPAGEGQAGTGGEYLA